MSANTAPIFLFTPTNKYSSTGLSANTALDGTGSVVTLMTAGANGSKISKIRLTHMGTNVATVVRFFINNGSNSAVAANNALVYEYTMAANTVSQVAASVPAEILLDMPVQATYKLNVTIGSAIASGIMVALEGGDF